MNKGHGPNDKRATGPRNSLSNAAYYGVITCSLLVGLLGYTAGASLEGSLMRVVITLLGCTAVGYLLNLVLWLASSSESPESAERPARTDSASLPGGAVNLMVGDDHVPA